MEYSWVHPFVFGIHLCFLRFVENHHIIKEYNFIFQMQWRMREEDGQADEGRGWAGG